MFSVIRKRMTYANVAMTLALVFAMSGGAYAAGRYLITSTKQIKPSVLKQLQGKAGPAGPAGAQGIAGGVGPQGPAGVKGENGTNGTNGANGTGGASGANGANGKSVVTAAASGGECKAGGTKLEVEGSGKSEHVCNGEAAPGGGFPETLPSGKTEVGTWTFSVQTPGVVLVPISYTIPVKPAPLEGHYLYVKPNRPLKEYEAECPGTVKEPSAEKGYLCVYANSEENGAEFEQFFDETGYVAGPELKFNASQARPAVPPASCCGTSGVYGDYAKGSWAVTAE